MTRDNPSPAVLAIRLRQLGDVLVTLGSIRALKLAAPGHRIVFVADRAYHSLLRRAAFIDELCPEPPKISGLGGLSAYERYVDALRRSHPSCVLDFHSNTRSAVLSFLSGAPVRVGFDVRLRKVFYTDVEPRALFRDGQRLPRNSHESALALVRRAGFAAARGGAAGTIPTTPEERERGRRLLADTCAAEGDVEGGVLVGLNPGKPYPAKAWPADRFGRLARMLREAGVTVVVLWGPAEKESAERVVEESAGAARIAPALALDQLPGALSAFRAVVTIDSGLKHLAVAVGVPTVTLFGPTSPSEWHVAAAHDRYLYAQRPCSPCRLLECPYDPPCMWEIAPEEVRDAVLGMAGTPAGGTGGKPAGGAEPVKK